MHGAGLETDAGLLVAAGRPTAWYNRLVDMPTFRYWSPRTQLQVESACSPIFSSPRCMSPARWTFFVAPAGGWRFVRSAGVSAHVCRRDAEPSERPDDRPSLSRRRGEVTSWHGTIGVSSGRGPLRGRRRVRGGPPGGDGRGGRRGTPCQAPGPIPRGCGPRPPPGIPRVLAVEGRRVVVFVSGQGPTDLKADMETQVRQTFDRIGLVLKAAGALFADPS